MTNLRPRTNADRLRQLVTAIDDAITADPQNPATQRARILRVSNFPSADLVMSMGAAHLTLHGVTGTGAGLSAVKADWHWRARCALGGHPAPIPSRRAVQLEWATETLRNPDRATPQILAQSIAIIRALTDNLILRTRADQLAGAA